jgi:tRNA(Ile)-lysidine synthase
LSLTILAQFKEALQPLINRQTKLIVAYSGGLDSHVLLHLCATLKPSSLSAIHVHHGLNKAADEWAAHCEQICQTLAVPFRLICVNAQAERGESREERARNARYDALKQVLQEGDCLLTAQHQEDQAETLLLQLFRGSGVQGLAAMPKSIHFGLGYLERPLLDFSQKMLQDYAQENHLNWVEDDSNLDESYDRNHLRQTIIPLLENRWQNISSRLSRSSHHCGEAAALLEELADRLLPELQPEGNALLYVDKVLALSEPQQRLILRRWIASQGGRLPSTAVLNRIMREVLEAHVEAMPCVSWSGYDVRRYRNRLYFIPALGAFDSADCFVFDKGRDEINLPDSRLLKVKIVEGKGISVDCWDKGAVTIRFRQGGERLKPSGRSGSHSLKNLFQEAGVPPWERKRMPLIYINDRLAAVGGLWSADWCKAEGKEKAILLCVMAATDG